MLYKTHKKFGYLFGLTALLISLMNGWIVSLVIAQGFYNKVLTFMIVYMAIRGSIFGASFPDIDSPGSVPARHYPMLRRLFKGFGIKHRGKISHDYFSITVIYGVSYLVMSYALNVAKTVDAVSFILTGYLMYWISRDIINQVVFKLIKDKKRRKGLTTILKPLGAIIFYVLFSITGFISLSQGGLGLIQTNNFIAPVLKTLIIFGWVGSISHLFADMLTNSGVWAFGMEIAPAQVILVVRKLPVIGKRLLVNEMKTGTRYEDIWNRIVTVMILPLGLLVLLAISGGDIHQIIGLFQ